MYSFTSIDSITILQLQSIRIRNLFNTSTFLSAISNNSKRKAKTKATNQESNITYNSEMQTKKEAAEKMLKPARDRCCRERCRGHASVYAGPSRTRRPYKLPLLARSVNSANAHREEGRERERERRLLSQCKMRSAEAVIDCRNVKWEVYGSV